MAWSALSLADPVSDASALSQNLSVLTVSPWTHGIKEGQGNHTWLSFPNAIDAVIAGLDVPVGHAVFAVAVAAASFKDLAGQIGQLSSVLPLKQLSQWQRHAQTLVTLEVDKMDLVDAVAESGGAPLNAIATVKTQMEKAISQDALAESSALAGADPLANLSSFEAAKVAHDVGVNGDLPALSGGAGLRLYADADIATALRTGGLGGEYTMTAMVVWIGTPADLAYLVEMMP